LGSTPKTFCGDTVVGVAAGLLFLRLNILVHHFFQPPARPRQYAAPSCGTL
jgi:hypothetical protein